MNAKIVFALGFFIFLAFSTSGSHGASAPPSKPTEIVSPNGRKCSGENEEFSSAPRFCCPQSCADLEGKKPCALDCVTGGGCVCRPGFLRDAARQNRCVPRDECPSKKPLCPKQNQVHADTVPCCPETCQNRNEARCQCVKDTPGCVCAPGFLLNNRSGECVPEGECRSLTSPIKNAPPKKQ